MNKNEVLFDEVGTVEEFIEEDGYSEWRFKTKNKIYSYNICFVIDELLDTETQDGDKFRIIIEKVED